MRRQAFNVATWLAVAALSCLGSSAPEAASKARFSNSQKSGEFSFTISENDGRDGTTATLMCSPGDAQYAVILVLGSGGATRTATDITIAADGAELGTKRFEGAEEMLMLLTDRDAGRALGERLAKAKSFTLGYGARGVAFVPADHPAEIQRYIDACRY